MCRDRGDDQGRVETTAAGGLARKRRDRVNVVDEPALQLGDGERRIDRDRQCCHARHVWRSHARAAEGAIPVARDGAVDVYAGRGQIDRRRPVVAEGGQRILVVGCRHTDNRRRIVRGWVAWRGVGVCSTVAGGRHEHDAGSTAGVDGVEQAGVVVATPPAVVRDPHVDAVGRPHHRRVVHGTDGVGEVPRARRIEEFERHERDVPTDTGHSPAVVAHSADRARHVRAVVVVVHRVAVVVHKVIPVHVVHEAVVVVIDAVACNLTRIGPDVGGQIGMGVVDAGVDHAHDHRTAARRDIPCLGGVDVGIGRASRLPDVVEAVELRE